MADEHPRRAADLPNESAVSSPRTSTDSRTSHNSHTRQPSIRISHLPPATPHRQNYPDSLRGIPTSTHARRPSSLTPSAIQSLIDHPPVRAVADPAFSNRDWRQISIGELASSDDLKFVEVDTGIEEATNLLIESGTPVLLIRETTQDTAAVGTFGYSDLNAYLLLVVGLAQPHEEQVTSFRDLAQKVREGSKIPLKDVKDLGTKEPLAMLPASANLRTAVEMFGSGVHRIIVVKENGTDVVGIVSQSRLVNFLWENGRSFPVIDQLYLQYLKDLRISSQKVFSINGDKPLFQALKLMDDEGISSLAVVDHHLNVIGNISTVDVNLLTKSSSVPLLYNSCIHFISVILSTRGLDGKDSFPVFYVNPNSTLAHTVAKLVATKSHRLWVTDPQSPSSSAPSTPAHSAVYLPVGVPPTNSTNASQHSPFPYSINAGTTPSGFSYPSLSHPPPSPVLASAMPSIPAPTLPGACLSGRLVGVVSLTDILNLYARASGLSPADPSESRSRRRRSSSSSLGVRKSGDVGREMGLRGGP